MVSFVLLKVYIHKKPKNDFNKVQEIQRQNISQGPPYLSPPIPARSRVKTISSKQKQL